MNEAINILRKQLEEIRELSDQLNNESLFYAIQEFERALIIAEKILSEDDS